MTPWEHGLRHQEAGLVTLWNASYGVLDVPPVAFDSWTTAESQIGLVNQQATEPLRWRDFGTTRARILETPGGANKQLWVPVERGYNYRAVAGQYAESELQVERPPTDISVDHVLPQSRARTAGAVTMVLFVPRRVNSSWGGGHERQTAHLDGKLRHALSLVGVAKGLGIYGWSDRKERTHRDVAVELAEKGIRPITPEAFGTTDVDRLENELRLTAGLQPVLAPAAPTSPMLTGEELRCACTEIPRVLESVSPGFDSHDCRRLLKGFAAPPGEREASALVGLMLSNRHAFGLDQVMRRHPDTRTDPGAVGWLLDRSHAVTGHDRLMRLGISGFDF